MAENKFYSYFRNFVTALILLFTFLLPLKFGGIVGIPEATSMFTDNFFAAMIITWPVFLFPLISGILLLLALLAFPVKKVSFFQDKSLIVAVLWCLLALASLWGAVNASVWDFVIMEITHLFGLAAYVMTLYLFLNNMPNSKKMLSASIIAGLVVVIYMGLEQYFVGFEEMRQFIAKQERTTGIVGNSDLKARIFDDRVHAPFTGCNSLAGYLLLTAPLCVVALWKFCEKIEPPKMARLIFVPVVIACIFFIFFTTKARGAFLSLILSCGVFIVVFPVKKWLRMAIFILAPVAVVGGAYVIYKYGRGFDSMKVRVDYMRVSFKMLFAHPIAGAGWGDFFYDYMRLKSIPTSEAPHTPHNLFLACGGQAGLDGLFFSIAALFYPLWTGMKKVRVFIKQHIYMREEVALFFGLTAFVFHAMMDIDLQIPGLIATASAITLLIVIPDSEDKQQTVDYNNTSSRIILWISALIVAVVAFIGGWHLVCSEYVLSKLENLCDLGKKTPEQIAKITAYEVNEKLEAAVKARPYSPIPYSKAGAFYMATRRFDMAERCYKKALELSPKCAAYYFRLFTILETQGRSEEAKNNLLKAIELFPNNPKYRIAEKAFIK